MKGKVKIYFEDKGYGFLITDSGDDLFFHVSDFCHHHSKINKDVKVLFDTEKTKKGLAAKDIRLPDTNSDPRIDCPHCQKKIRPNPRYRNGLLIGSICPFCLEFVKKVDFSKEREAYHNALFWLAMAVLFFLIGALCVRFW